MASAQICRYYHARERERERYIYIYIHVYVYINIYVYIHTHFQLPVYRLSEVIVGHFGETSAAAGQDE